MWTSPWTQRLLWTVAGVALATVFFVVVDSRSSVAPVEPALTPSAAAPAGEAASPTPAGGECHLGVVVARDAVVVAAEVGGLLQTIDVRVGDEVRKGQVLATLDTRDTEHQLEIERASLRTVEAEKRRNDLAVLQAEEEEKRRQRLEGLISSEEIAAAKFQRQQAEAQREAANAEISRVKARLEQLEDTLERSRIRAPFAGTVAQRYLDAGALVSQGTPVLRLLSSGGFLVRFAMPPEEARRVSIGDPIRVAVDGLDATVDGRVEHLAPEIDAASQMLFVEASLMTGAAGPAVPSGAMARVALFDDDGHAPSCPG